MAAKETVPRGVSYYCVPVCHSYSDKVVDGKMVRLNKPPENSKARKTWIARLRGVRQNFLQSLKQGRAAYILKTKKARSHGVSFQGFSPQSQPRDVLVDGIILCPVDPGNR